MEKFLAIFLLVGICYAVPFDSLSELEDEIETYVKHKVNSANNPTSSDPTQSPPDLSEANSCVRAGIGCQMCAECDNRAIGGVRQGWCLDEKSRNEHGGKCLCWYGWTGPNAKYIANSVQSNGLGINRLVADNCITPCHYTHDVRNITCADRNPTDPCDKCRRQNKLCIDQKCVDPCKDCNDRNVPCIDLGKDGNGYPKKKCGCHPDCGKHNGECRVNTNGKDDECVCCRGWAGPNKKYSKVDDKYTADYCNAKCHYKGYQIENDNCHNPPYPPACDPKCAINGKCIEETGYCECCDGWTGKDSKFGIGPNNHKIYASRVCDVQCPNSKVKRELKCVNPGYIEHLIQLKFGRETFGF